ncbi:MAG: SDR family oxidoreductase [Phycisphaerae bacterium]|nr:SDR family oxidoreductase [Phycisphaerae bacterium]MBN8596503.1 SDR family oxidoreductase [Planctomycetota bacterium]
MANRESVAIVSGACGDIGRAIVLELARRGAAVALSDVGSAQEAEGVLREVRALGRVARYDRVDVSDAEAVDRWVDDVRSTTGDVAWAVASAATVTIAGTMQVSSGAWKRELDVNLNGAFYVARAAAGAMLGADRGGRIVFVGSWAAHAPHANLPAYSVSKAGVRMLCRCMALELADRGILVNEIAPGYVDAGLSAEVFRKDPGAREKASARVPLGRMMTAEDVAKQVGYLCFDSSSHTTGSTLLMDGGLSLGTPVRGSEFEP